ncbi:MAG: phosphomannomutase [Clostridia bacterium]|nr:phosphomannomutase [Clostridia bacterium]MBQ8340184.1 phosphomannomutase [Clostridia bacterium]
MRTDYKLIAFDLDGTLTQHRTKLGDENRAVLDKLGRKYKLLMTGAGACMRIFGQMNEYPIDIIGNYGMQVSRYNPETKQPEIIENAYVEPDRERTMAVCQAIREKYGFTEYAGDPVEFHDSGMITFPLIGTKAKIEDKLAFDPDRSRRKVFYHEVKEAFPGATVFIGGSSSFDIAPYPYNKLYALDHYCEQHGLTHRDILYCGDDYGIGGNDEQVYNSDIDFVKVDDYRKLGEYLAPLLVD